MPIDIKEESGMFVAEFHGILTGSELLEGAKKVRVIEDTDNHTPPRLIDLSRVEAVNLDFESMHLFAKMRAASKLKNHARSAIIAPSQAQFGFARMYQSLNQNDRLEVSIFKDKASALAWLMSP